MDKKKAIFPGQFNPFHLGHLYVLGQAFKKGYDKVYILISQNENKALTNKQEIKININNWLLNFQYRNKIEIIINEGLTIDWVEKLGVYDLIRGYRNDKDFVYEQNLMDEFKKQNKQINFTLIQTIDSLKNISSSKIRLSSNLK